MGKDEEKVEEQEGQSKEGEVVESEEDVWSSAEDREGEEGLRRISVLVPSKVYRKLEDIATKRGITKSDVVRNVLDDRLKNVKAVDEKAIKKLLADCRSWFSGFELEKFFQEVKARELNKREYWSEANLVLLKEAILQDALFEDDIADELENEQITKIATELGIEESFLRKAWNLEDK